MATFDEVIVAVDFVLAELVHDAERIRRAELIPELTERPGGRLAVEVFAVRGSDRHSLAWDYADRVPRDEVRALSRRMFDAARAYVCGRAL